MNEENISSLEEYFLLHPDEESGFYDFMAEMLANDEPVELPEDWSVIKCS